MSLSKLSSSYKQNDALIIPATVSSLANMDHVYDQDGNFMGTVYTDNRDAPHSQWFFIPVGSQVWYDNDENEIATFNPARQPVSKSA